MVFPLLSPSYSYHSLPLSSMSMSNFPLWQHSEERTLLRKVCLIPWLPVFDYILLFHKITLDKHVLITPLQSEPRENNSASTEYISINVFSTVKSPSCLVSSTLLNLLSHLAVDTCFPTIPRHSFTRNAKPWPTILWSHYLWTCISEDRDVTGLKGHPEKSPIFHIHWISVVKHHTFNRYIPPSKHALRVELTSRLLLSFPEEKRSLHLYEPSSALCFSTYLESCSATLMSDHR